MRVSLSIVPLLAVCVEAWLESSDSGQNVLGGISANSTYRVVTNERLPGYQLRVKTIPSNGLCDPDVFQVSGYFDVSTGDHIFFWFFESRNDPQTSPLVSWFNGGPGSTSFTGLLMELGPCWILENGADVAPNPYSWNNNANIMFIDQPLTVGFSYTERNTVVSTSERAAKDIYAFLQLFYTEFPQYAEVPYFLSGESYAGHYLPAFATEILAQNDAENGTHIPLSGIALGNGWVDPFTQSGEAPEYVCTGPYADLLVEDSSGRECQRMRAQAKRCQNLIATCNARPSRWACAPAMLYCEFLPWKENPVSKKGLNPFDVRKACYNPKSGACYAEEEWISIYLNRPEIKAALGVPEDVKFNPGSNTVGAAFAASGDVFFNSGLLFPALLDAGVRVLNYAGKADSRCDYFGDFAWMSKIDHEWAREIGRTALSPWVSNGAVVGEKASAGNFTFLAIEEAGHLTPFDQPAVMLDVFNRFITGDL